MKKMKNSRNLTEENFKFYNTLWHRKLLKPSPVYPLPFTEFDFLLYVVARINENHNKPRTVENKNYLNHIETSPFRSVSPSKNKPY
jgi:hypothetical protein